MKKLIFLLFFIPLVSYGQTKDYKGLEMCLAVQTYGFMSNTEADKSLDLIMNVSGLNKNFILAACDKINNALAIRYNNERYILYDPDFMNNIEGESKWRNLTILAHEVAHHLNNHPVDLRMAKDFDRKSYSQIRRQELEADEFAGFIMYKLGGPLDEAIKAISSVSSDEDDTYSTHPSKQKRINALKAGYKRSGYKENSLLSVWDKLIEWIYAETENKTEETKEGKKEQKQKTGLNSKTFKYTTTDFYTEKFRKTPDYGNYVDVSSSYFTPDILYSRTTEVLNAEGNKRYGKLYEGLSYVNRRIQLESGVEATEYGHRAQINFYLGNYKDALSDVNKEISLRNDIWMIKHTLDLRSNIKYMLGDYTGAINDLEEHYNYFIKKETNCEIETYYWFIVYHLAINDYSNADFYLGKVNTYPSYNKWCGTNHINKIKSRANKLTAYIRN